MRLHMARFYVPRCPDVCAPGCEMACCSANRRGCPARCHVRSRVPRATRRILDQLPRLGFGLQRTPAKIVDPLTNVSRPSQVPAWVPPLGWLRKPMRKLEVGLEHPTGMAPQVDEGLDLRRIGVDTGVLSLEFRGPHSQADIVAIYPHTDPVKGDHSLASELDSDSGKVRVPSWDKHPSALVGFCRTSGSFLQNRHKARQEPRRLVAAALRNGDCPRCLPIKP